MRPATGARCDRFSAAVARLLTILATLLALWGLAVLVLHGSFPLWGWVAWAPDVLALTVLGAVRTAARSLSPRPTYRPFGG